MVNAILCRVENVYFYKNKFMGLVYAEITLISGEDLILAKRNIIGEEEVKQITVSMLVDTGSVYMCINENVQEQILFGSARRFGGLVGIFSCPADIGSNHDSVADDRHRRSRTQPI